MAYVEIQHKERGKFKVGDWVVTRRKLKCADGYFEKGTKVRITRKSCYGYDLEDEFGNTVICTGFHSIKKL